MAKDYLKARRYTDSFVAIIEASYLHGFSTISIHFLVIAGVLNRLSLIWSIKDISQDLFFSATRVEK